MYKMLKFGVGVGVLALISSCGSSEHFMQDDVYNTRTPIMPPGTDLNDVTDYATFVAKKEQEAEPERTAYVSPREYNDYFYYSQFRYYGYSPYSTLTGIGYPGYGNFHYPMGNGYYGNSFHPSMGYSYWNYNNIGIGSYYGGSYMPYGGYYYNDPYYNHYPYYSGNTSWSTASSKPKTVSNLSNAQAGVRRSTTPPVGYTHQIAANPGMGARGTGVARTSNSRISTVSSPSPVVNSGGRSTGVNRSESVRPVSSGRAVPNAGGGVQRSGTYQQRPTVNRNEGTRSTRPTMNNSNNNNAPTRVSTPTMRSGGSSGGSVSPSSGGSRSGGRR